MAKLTELEQQEIIRCIEAGRSLPDRYRFLLFEDKREVELEWNGKTGEVCNVVLPFQVIEHVDEPRAEIEKHGGLKLIYIDPPFDVGADFSMDNAEPTTGFATFHGKKTGRLVCVGPVNMPITRLFVEEVILECRKKHIFRVVMLGFEFEMGLFHNVLDEAKAKDIDIAPKYISAGVFDKRAVEKNQVVFHDVSFIEMKPIINKSTVAVELTDFSVFYSQDSIAAAEAAIKDKQNKVVVEKGQIVKVSKDKNGIVNRELLTQHLTDRIDYWSVDFDFESKREFIRVQNAEGGEREKVWTSDYVFENECQSFRTKKDRSLEKSCRDGARSR